MDIAKPMSLNWLSVIMTYFRCISTTPQQLQCYNVRNECNTTSMLICTTKPIRSLEQGEKCFHKTLTNICIKYTKYSNQLHVALFVLNTIIAY